MTGTVAARLLAQPFFAALTDSQRGALAEDGTAVTFAAGERLFDEGGVADLFWLIEQGGIALDMRVPGRGDQIVETLGPGTVLGWSWLHPPYRWHFGAVARVATTAIEFDAPSVTLSGTPHDRIADAFLGDCRFNMGPGRHVRFPVGLIPGTKD